MGTASKSRSFRFGTVGAPVSTPAKPGGSVGAVEQTASLGLQALEIAWVQSVRISAETCAAIKSMAERLDIAISIHAPYYINLNAGVDEWPKSRKRLMDAAFYGYLAGATDIIFHPGSYFSQPREDVLKIALPRLDGCVNELAQKNIIVTLRPETMGKSAMLGSLEDVLELSQLSGVLPCLDFAHLHSRPGDGTVNSYDAWMQILDRYAQALGDGSLKGLHIHLSGIEYGPKGEKNHLPFRESDIDTRSLLQALHNTGSAGRIVCESPILEEDALYLMSMWDSQ